MSKEVMHLQRKKSFWSGRITAYCGATSEAGEHKKPLFNLGRTCPACERIYRQSKKEGRR